MPKHVKARVAQNEREERAVRKLARSQHAPADWIWHARMVVESWAGKTPDQIAVELQCIPRPSAYTWPVSTNKASRDSGFNRVRDGSRG